jgi:hypothetical protein
MIRRKQWKKGASLKKSVIERNSGDWGWGNSNSCKINRIHIYNRLMWHKMGPNLQL